MASAMAACGCATLSPQTRALEWAFGPGSPHFGLNSTNFGVFDRIWAGFTPIWPDFDFVEKSTKLGPTQSSVV